MDSVLRTLDMPAPPAQNGRAACLEEALMGCRGAFCSQTQNPAIQRATQYVSSVVTLRYGNSLFIWNDTNARTANEAFAAVDDAIQVAKEVSVIPRG